MADWAAVSKPRDWIEAGAWLALHRHTSNQAPQARALEAWVGTGQETRPFLVKLPFIFTAWPADGATFSRRDEALQTVKLRA